MSTTTDPRVDGSGRRQRLGGQDALWLEMDTPGNLMVVDSLFWTEEPIDWDRYLDTMRERLWDRYPVFRSVAVRGDDGGWWWEEQLGAEVESRYEHVVLPDPGGEAELQALVAEQRVVQLDPDEPLWRSFLIDNYRGGSAVLFRAHHAIADGIRMVQLTLSIFDADPDGTPAVPVPEGVAHEPAVEAADQTPPGVLGLASAAVGGSVQLARTAVTNPLGAAHTALSLGGAAAGALTSRTAAALPGDLDTVRKLVLGTRNDNAAWTGHVGDRKTITWTEPLSLAETKRVAHAHGATVNDVLVTCVADALRTYLETQGTVCHSVTWDVPVNLQPFDPDLPIVLGNGFALVQLELPTHTHEIEDTLRVVQDRMGRIKRGHEAVVDFGIQALIARMSKGLYRAAIDLLANRAVGVLTNVPGPQVPLYAAGQRVVAMMGWAPTAADQAMSMTIYSYDGKVFVGLAADAGLVPDAESVMSGFVAAFERLSASA
ncbi:WS/DGAT domain-containing protein [Nocardioides sp.]|uniref:WS/DGAT domain-containing protein n=1 Tax=Nocardioides sp. TaxID=35761 RepID=UPI003784A513